MILSRLISSYFAVLIAAFGFTSICVAEDNAPLNIAGIFLDHRFTHDSTIQYGAFINAMADKGLQVDLELAPIMRSIRSVVENENVCLFPSSMSALIRVEPALANHTLVQSDTVEYVAMIALTLPGKPLITSLDQMRGQRVAIWNGLNPETFLPGIDAMIEKTNSEETRVKMLFNNRADVILGFIPDVHLVTNKLGLPALQSDGALELISGNGTHLVCHDTPTNRAHITQFNQILADLYESGEIKDIFGPHVLYRE